MNVTIRTILLSAVCLSSFVGCAARTVRVNAYLSQDLPFPTAQGDTPPAIAVVVGSDPDEPLLEAEVARKIKHLVRQQGFTIGEQASAAYVLTCWVSIDDGNAETTTDYAYCGPGFAAGYGYGGHGYGGGLSIYAPGGYYEVPETTIYYTRFLGLTLYERERWAAAATKKELGQAAIWTCTARSVGTSSDLRSWVNFLLAGAFEQFGADTGKQLRIKFAADDARVLEIARSGRSRTTDEAPPARPESPQAQNEKETDRDAE